MEHLKVLLSSFVLLLITSVIYFAIYFLFPGFSVSFFGISSQSDGFVSSSETDASAVPNEDGSFLSFVTGREGSQIVSMLMQSGIISSSLSENDIEAVASQADSYLENTGQSIDDIFSNSNIARMLTGNMPEEVSSFIQALEQGQ